VRVTGSAGASGISSSSGSASRRRAFGIGEQHGQFVVVEAERSQVNVGIPQFGQFRAEQIVIEGREFG
jgi:hypothetical protein